MSLEIQGTVTERSNGVIRITPDAGAPAARIEMHEGALGSKQLPAMGDNVTVTIAVTEPVALTEQGARLTLGNPPLIASADASFDEVAVSPAPRRKTT